MTFKQLTLAPASQLQAVHLVRVFAWEVKATFLWEIWKAFVSTSGLLFERACNTSKKRKRENYGPCGTDEAVNPEKIFLCHLWAITSDTGLSCRVAWSRCIPSPPSLSYRSRRHSLCCSGKGDCKKQHLCPSMGTLQKLILFSTGKTS